MAKDQVSAKREDLTVTVPPPPPPREEGGLADVGQLQQAHQQAVEPEAEAAVGGTAIADPPTHPPTLTLNPPLLTRDFMLGGRAWAAVREPL